MTKSTITRERIELIANFHRAMTLPPSHAEIEELARMALAAMDSEPYGFTDGDHRGMIYEPQYADRLNEPLPVYRHAQPAPVVPKSISVREAISALESADAVTTIGQAYKMGWNHCRAAMLQELPKSAGASNNCRSGENVQDLQAGNSPVIPGAEQRIADAVELLKQAAPAMLADNSGPDGPLVGRLKFPVIPDGSFSGLFGSARALLDALYEFGPDEIAISEHVTNLEDALRNAAAPTGIPVNSNGWIPVSERMPETDGNYWGWWSESKRQGPVWFIKSELQAQFQSHEITHWMPLPAAPQEVKP